MPVNDAPRQKTCSRCQAPFLCGPGTGKAGCWCQDLPPVLPLTGDDCLCPRCAQLTVSLRPAQGRAKEKVVLSWSGGKDSAMAAYHLMSSQKYEIVSLLTTVTEDYDRISMHGVRRELLERQAEAMGLPLRTILIPKECVNETYERKMAEALARFQADGVTKVAFGDLFLEDLKRYRDERLSRAGMTGVYPVWKRDTSELVRTFIGLGFKARLCCVDTQVLDGAFAGREIDLSLLDELPGTVDPCGENGEFHSFVYAGPIFKSSIPCKAGDRTLRDGRFSYCDLLP